MERWEQSLKSRTPVYCHAQEPQWPIGRILIICPRHGFTCRCHSGTCQYICPYGSSSSFPLLQNTRSCNIDEAPEQDDKSPWTLVGWEMLYVHEGAKAFGTPTEAPCSVWGPATLWALLTARTLKRRPTKCPSCQRFLIKLPKPLQVEVRPRKSGTPSNSFFYSTTEPAESFLQQPSVVLR